MSSRMLRWVVVALVASLSPLAPATARAQEEAPMDACPNGEKPVGSLGIGEFRCSGDRCPRAIVIDESGIVHTFTTEPEVHDLERPAVDALREGDVLVAIGGKLITTREGGRVLERLQPGRPVELKIRRKGEERTVRIDPAARCDRRVFRFHFEPQLSEEWRRGMEELGRRMERFDWEGHGESWGRELGDRLGRMMEDFDWESFVEELPDGSVVIGAPRRVEPPYELGVVLSCGGCGWRRGPDGEPVWHGAQPPRVRRVVEGGPADAAGIEAGDVLLVLGGHSFVGERGRRELGRLEPGRQVELRYLEGGETIATTAITPRRPTTGGNAPQD